MEKTGGLRTKGVIKISSIEKPLLSVITVVYNGLNTLEKTILSVITQTYDNIEYIIIDGGSTDGTLELIKKYDNNIDFWISDSDKGIYDAMNKGIALANGDWLNFMNTGDKFTNHSVIQSIFNREYPSNITFIYSDFFVEYNGKLIKLIADFDKGVILHQSVLYKRILHLNLGNYYVTEKMIVSDYLFFNAVLKDQIIKVDIPISQNEVAGVSNAPWCSLQKICFDFIFSRISLFKMIFLIGVFQFKRFARFLLGKNNIERIMWFLRFNFVLKDN